MPIVLLVAAAGGPRRIGSGDDERLSYRDGGGVTKTLFGLVLLALSSALFGFFFVRFVPTIFRQPPHGKEWLLLPLVCLLIFGNAIMFGWAGIVAICKRNGVVFDRAAGTVTVWSSLAGHRRRSQTQSLADYEAVTVARNGGSIRSGPVYGIFLIGGQQARLWTVDLRTSKERAELFAGEMAGFLGLPVRG